MSTKKSEVLAMIKDGMHELLEVGTRSKYQWRRRKFHLGFIEEGRSPQCFYFTVKGERFEVVVRKPRKLEE